MVPKFIHQVKENIPGAGPKPSGCRGVSMKYFDEVLPGRQLAFRYSLLIALSRENDGSKWRFRDPSKITEPCFYNKLLLGFWGDGLNTYKLRTSYKLGPHSVELCQGLLSFYQQMNISVQCPLLVPRCALVRTRTPTSISRLVHWCPLKRKWGIHQNKIIYQTLAIGGKHWPFGLSKNCFGKTWKLNTSSVEVWKFFHSLEPFKVWNCRLQTCLSNF